MSSIESANRVLAAACIAPVVASPFNRNLQAAKGVKTFTRTSAGNYLIELEDPAAFLEGLVLGQLPTGIAGNIGAQITPASTSTYDPDLQVPKVQVTVTNAEGSPFDPQFFYLYVLKFNEGEGLADSTFVVPTPAVNLFAGTPKYIDGFVVAANTGETATVGTNPDGSTGGAATDSTGSQLITSATSKALDLAVAGAGGLDTGSVAASTLYNVFVIWSSTLGVSTLASLSATAPTLPTGYTKFRRVGVVLTDGSSNILPINTIGSLNTREIFYQTPQSVLAGGVATAAAAVSLAACVPSGSLLVSLLAQLTGTTAGTADAGVTATPSPSPAHLAISATGQFEELVFGCPVNAGNVSYKVSIASVNLTLWVRSFQLSL